jgi:hypothetical protein
MTMQSFVGLNDLRSLYGEATTARRMRSAVLATVFTFTCTAITLAEGSPEPKQPLVRMIGATTMVTEVTTGLPLPARVDTGATSCSIHCDAVEITDAAKNPKGNIGKSIRFLVKNADGKSYWVKSKIVDYVLIRTAQTEEERYKVPIKLRWEDVEKKVHVTLNDRQHMKYPMLLGRNFLQDDFLVNVSMDAKE